MEFPILVFVAQKVPRYYSNGEALNAEEHQFKAPRNTRPKILNQNLWPPGPDDGAEFSWDDAQCSSHTPAASWNWVIVAELFQDLFKQLWAESNNGNSTTQGNFVIRCYWQKKLDCWKETIIIVNKTQVFFSK
jgi:hypothetical protein